jgi:hypothetical protein
LEEEVGEGFEDWQEKSAIVVTFHRKVWHFLRRLVTKQVTCCKIKSCSEISHLLRNSFCFGTLFCFGQSLLYLYLSVRLDWTVSFLTGFQPPPVLKLLDKKPFLSRDFSIGGYYNTLRNWPNSGPWSQGILAWMSFESKWHQK